MVAIHKPSGLLVHRSQIDAHETRNAMAMIRDQLGQWVYPVHRLDKPVSGILLFALDPKTAQILTESFQQRTTRKTYLALTRGYCPVSGTIDYPLKEEPDDATDRRAVPDKEPQSAITHFSRLDTVEIHAPVGRYPTARYSLMQLHPETGRKHQLRRHLKHIFHPIIGDTTHGDGHHNRFFRDRFAHRGLMLASTQLELRHPTQKTSIQLDTTPDPHFLHALTELGLSIQKDPIMASQQPPQEPL